MEKGLSDNSRDRQDQYDQDREIVFSVVVEVKYKSDHSPKTSVLGRITQSTIGHYGPRNLEIDYDAPEHCYLPFQSDIKVWLCKEELSVEEGDTTTERLHLIYSGTRSEGTSFSGRFGWRNVQLLYNISVKMCEQRETGTPFFKLVGYVSSVQMHSTGVGNMINESRTIIDETTRSIESMEQYLMDEYQYEDSTTRQKRVREQGTETSEKIKNLENDNKRLKEEVTEWEKFASGILNDSNHMNEEAQY